MQDYGLSDLDAFRRTHKPFHWYMEFNSVMANGGFDVIVGNPPWKEYSAVRKTYTVRGYATENCGNLHGICTERGLSLCKANGYMSFIVQLPLTSSSRMTTVRNVLRRSSNRLFVMTFDDRPGKLFDGLEHCRSSIFISQLDRKSPVSQTGLCTTRYQRWPTETRQYLFEQVEYAPIRSVAIHQDLFPKYANAIHNSIFHKVKTRGETELEGILRRRPTEHFIFYQEATQYWVKATVGLPYYAKNGIVGAPAHGRYLYFDTFDAASSVCALLHSSLFYAYFVAYGDCFHLSDNLVSGFPASPELFQQRDLVTLSEQLINDLRANAITKTIRTSNGDAIEYAEFYGAQSKPIIDEIDRVLAQHYGFTDEELDFIINYDIKYRMGREADTGDEGEEA